MNEIAIIGPGLPASCGRYGAETRITTASTNPLHTEIVEMLDQMAATIKVFRAVLTGKTLKG